MDTVDNIEKYDSLYNKLFTFIDEVYNIACDKYGSDRVCLTKLIGKEGIIEKIKEEDLDTCLEDDVSTLIRELDYQCAASLIIHYPEIVMTNENNNKHTIYDVFVKIYLNMDGTMYSTIGVTRSTYSRIEYNRGYVHSHLPSSREAGRFDTPCFGSSPILLTMETLREHYDKINWIVLFSQIDQMLCIESLEGGPYQSFEDLYDNITGYDYMMCDNAFDKFNIIKGILKGILKDFILYYINNCDIKFTNVNNVICIAKSWYHYYIELNSMFIEWLQNNKSLYEYLDIYDKIYPQINSGKYDIKDIEWSQTILQDIMSVYIVTEKAVYYNYRFMQNELSDNNNETSDKILFKFNGEDIKLRIIDEDYKFDLRYMLNSAIASCILHYITLILNNFNNHE